MDKQPIGPALSLAALFALSSCPLPAADIQVYECTHKGIRTFSDGPCGSAARHVELEYPSAAPGGRSTVRSIERAAAPIATAAERRLLDTEITNVEERITRLQNEEQLRIAELTQQRLQGTEHLDLEAFRLRMDARIHRVMNRYGTAIDRESTRLAELQARLAALPPPQP
jgi:hypothetical protein